MSDQTARCENAKLQNTRREISRHENARRQMQDIVKSLSLQPNLSKSTDTQQELLSIEDRPSSNSADTKDCVTMPCR